MSRSCTHAKMFTQLGYFITRFLFNMKSSLPNSYLSFEKFVRARVEALFTKPMEGHTTTGEIVTGALWKPQGTHVHTCGSYMWQRGAIGRIPGWPQLALWCKVVLTDMKETIVAAKSSSSIGSAGVQACKRQQVAKKNKTSKLDNQSWGSCQMIVFSQPSQCRVGALDVRTTWTEARRAEF